MSVSGVHSGSSRIATDRLLSDLRSRRWRPAAWVQFGTAATMRSVEQAVKHRPALAQATALHSLFFIMGSRSRPWWVLTSWTLTATHLGLLEDRTHLGSANAITIVRANLPATGTPLGRWLAIFALSTDFVDGKLARYTGTTTPFGRFADPLADTFFWTWLSFKDTGRAHRIIQAAVVLTWLAPLLAVTATSFGRGLMMEPPRPRWIRPAVVLQVLLAARTLRGDNLSTAHRPGVTVTWCWRAALAKPSSKVARAEAVLKAVSSAQHSGDVRPELARRLANRSGSPSVRSATRTPIASRSANIS